MSVRALGNPLGNPLGLPKRAGGGGTSDTLIVGDVIFAEAPPSGKYIRAEGQKVEQVDYPELYYEYAGMLPTYFSNNPNETVISTMQPNGTPSRLAHWAYLGEVTGFFEIVAVKVKSVVASRTLNLDVVQIHRDGTVSNYVVPLSGTYRAMSEDAQNNNYVLWVLPNNYLVIVEFTGYNGNYHLTVLGYNTDGTFGRVVKPRSEGGTTRHTNVPTEAKLCQRKNTFQAWSQASGWSPHYPLTAVVSGNLGSETVRTYPIGSYADHSSLDEGWAIYALNQAVSRSGLLSFSGIRAYAANQGYTSDTSAHSYHIVGRSSFTTGFTTQRSSTTRASQTEAANNTSPFLVAGFYDFSDDDLTLVRIRAVGGETKIGYLARATTSEKFNTVSSDNPLSTETTLLPYVVNPIRAYSGNLVLCLKGSTEFLVVNYMTREVIVPPTDLSDQLASISDVLLDPEMKSYVAFGDGKVDGVIAGFGVCAGGIGQGRLTFTLPDLTTVETTLKNAYPYTLHNNRNAYIKAKP